MTKNKKARPKELTMWDWDTLVAAWRYYEYRSTAASSMFPYDIVSRFFRGDYSKNACDRIAHQFWNVDHGSHGIDDWITMRNLPQCDALPWCKFWAFCKAWDTGFAKLTINHKDKLVVIEAFHCAYTNRWYPKEEYIANAFFETYIDTKSIVKIEEAQ